MSTHKKLSLVIGFYAAASLLLTILSLALVNLSFAVWEATLFVVGPLLPLFLLWLLASFTERRHSLDDRGESERNQFVGAVYSTGPLLLILEASAVLRMGGLVDAELSHRFLGIAIGLFVMILGNAMPKVALSSRSLSLQKLSGRAAQAANRFSGLMFIFAGASCVFVWALLPVDRAKIITVVLLLAAVMLSYVRGYLARRASRVSSDTVW